MTTDPLAGIKGDDARRAAEGKLLTQTDNSPRPEDGHQPPQPPQLLEEQQAPPASFKPGIPA